MTNAVTEVIVRNLDGGFLLGLPGVDVAPTWGTLKTATRIPISDVPPILANLVLLKHKVSACRTNGKPLATALPTVPVTTPTPVAQVETPKTPKKAIKAKTKPVLDNPQVALAVQEQQADEIERNAKAVEAPKGSVKRTKKPAPIQPEEQQKLINTEATKKTKKPGKFKLSPVDKIALVTLWKSHAGRDYGLLADLNNPTEIKRLDEAGFIVPYSPLTSDGMEPTMFKFTPIGKVLFVNFNKSPWLCGEPEPEPLPPRPRRKGVKASKEFDAEVGENIVDTKDVDIVPEWMRDTLPARLARLADRLVLNVRDALTHGNHLERLEIDPKDITPAVIKEAERLDAAWRRSLKDLEGSFNKKHAPQSSAAPVMTERPGKKTTPKAVEPKPAKEPKAVKEPKAKKPAKDKNAPKAKRAGKYPVDLGGEEIHSVTSVLRWIGANGYDDDDAKRFLAAIGIDGVSSATIHTQVYWGMTGHELPPADLNTDEVEVLEQYLKKPEKKAKVKAKKAKK